jgi:thiol-disulfide isomerase/thioredoxin|tara:strand:+ start:1073 stop:1567 length:495 start_codon:yes stop_codon:yes gene_type:complete
MLKKGSFLIFSICILFSITNCKTIQKPIVKAAEYIPYFTFTTLENKRFTKENLDNTRTKLFYYFNSECEHCEKQGSWISKDIKLFEDLEVIFISFEEMDAIKGYQNKFNFVRDNITFLQDTRLTFSDKFGVGEFPSIILYTKGGKLIKKFEGETKVSEIAASIQ